MIVEPQWRLRAPPSGDAVHSDPLLDRIYRSRGVHSAAELDHRLGRLLAPNLLGIEDAVAVLAQAIAAQKRILVIADYDCDGASACAIALSGLAALGAQNTDFLIPDRFRLGYGLSPEVVAVAASRQPDVILTVDNGISSIAGAEAVRALSHPCQLVITDHHLPPPVLPVADALVNPNQVGCAFASKAMAGCGVIFYVLLALRAKMGYTTRVDLRPLLDLVALGTVADVVPMDQNNRVLVQAGLKRIRQGLARPGLAALLEVAGRAPEHLSVADLGFAIAPRLNAAGRLEDMSLGVRCLLAADRACAQPLAAALQDLNDARRERQDSMLEDANSMLASLSDWEGRRTLVLYRDDFHEGIVGLVAARLKEHLHRPVVVFSKGENGQLKGSARSVPGVHIRDLIERVASSTGCVLRFGGHAMAAGLSLEAASLAVFSESLEKAAEDCLPVEPVIDHDGPLDETDFTLKRAHLLAEAGPFGAQFPAPVFHGNFRLEAATPMGGGRHQRLSLLSEHGQALEAVCFNTEQVPSTSWVELIYTLEINRWRGRERLQLQAQGLRAVSSRE